MEADKSTPDLEHVIYELICYFKKWGMWDDTFIQCGGKAYTAVKLADLLKEDENSIFYRCDKETGFRDLEDIAVCYGVNSSTPIIACCSDREDPLILLALGSAASGLIGYGEYIACYKDLVAEAKRFLLANTWLGERIKMDMYMEMDNLRDQDWIAQDYDSFEEWAFTHDILGDPVPQFFPDGPPLNLDHPEIYDDWVGVDPKGQIVSMDDKNAFYATHPDEGKNVESHLLHEFDELLYKHGLEYEPERGWLISIHKQQ